MKDFFQYLSYDEEDLIYTAAIIDATLQALPTDLASVIIRKIYDPIADPVINAEKLEAYVADSLNILSRIMDQEPHEEYTDKEMLKTELTAEALAKSDPAEVTRRLLEHDNTVKLLEGLYREIVEKKESNATM